MTEQATDEGTAMRAALTKSVRALSLVALTTASAVLTVAGASDASAYAWNDYSTTLPEYVTGATRFEVIVDGTNPVCSMTYAGATLSAAPWVFTYDPKASSHGAVGIAECDGSTDRAYVWAQEAFYVSGTILSAGGEGANSVSISNRTDVPAHASVTTEKGIVLSQVDIEPKGYADLTVPTTRVKRTSELALTIASVNGVTQNERLMLAKGWTPLMSNVGASFAPCSVLTWSYDVSGAPANAKNVVQDIEGSLNRLEALTGLRFHRTDDAAADIKYSWMRGGPSGQGGFEWKSDGKSEGHVQLNSQDSWTTDKYTGFASGRRAHGYGPAGRGWLLIHETMHALGFGHVDNPKSVMAPINRGQAAFTKGDLEGLATLYPKGGCGR